MAAINNYADLKQAVRSFLHRDDLTDDALDLANQFAATMINTRVKDWANVNNYTITDADRQAANSPVYALPGDFGSVEDIFFGPDVDQFGTIIGTEAYSAIVQSDQQFIRQLHQVKNLMNGQLKQDMALRKSVPGSQIDAFDKVQFTNELARMLSDLVND